MRTANGQFIKSFKRIPEVTFWFWVIKLIASALGETTGESATTWKSLGYFPEGSAFVVAFALCASAHVFTSRFRLVLFWFAIVTSTIAGKTFAHVFDQSMGIGYLGGLIVSMALVVFALGLWRRWLGTVAIGSITTPRAEILYWIMVVLSQALGAALGDSMENTQHGLRLGHVGAALVIAVWLGVVVVFYFWSFVSRALLLWSTFILTCPLSTSFGDFLDKPHLVGGFATNQYVASAFLAVLVFGAATVVPRAAEQIGVALELFFRAEFDLSAKNPKIPD